MVVDSKNIELFKNLSQFELNNVYYDFHNDFDCIKITFVNKVLALIFKNIVKGYIVSIKFQNVIFERIEFRNFSEMKNLTIDNLYRGRFEKDGKLLEMNSEKQSYFYIEFYEGHKIEFWCENIIVEKEE